MICVNSYYTNSIKFKTRLILILCKYDYNVLFILFLNFVAHCLDGLGLARTICY